jgi:hypothetical protein
MWDAIHKKTGKRYFAGDTWTPGLFDDPHKEKWISPKENITNWEELNVKEVKLAVVKAHYRKEKLVRSYFRIINCNNAKTCEESLEHRMKKTLLSLLLTHDAPIFLKYDIDRWPLSALPIDREKIRNNIKTIEVKRNINDSFKIADVLIPFKYTNFWGNGVVIEVRVSERKENGKEKEIFWFSRGYSIIWADKEDFSDDGYGISLKKNELNIIPYSIGQYILRERYERNFAKHIREMKETYNDIKNIDNTIKSSIEDVKLHPDVDFQMYNKFYIAKKNDLKRTLKKFEERINEKIIRLGSGGWDLWE